MRDPATLDEAYAFYKDNKFMRRDMLRMMIDSIKQLQTRIGAVDEAAVNDLRSRISTMETTIGNALIGAKSDEMRRQLVDRSVAKHPQPTHVAEREGGEWVRFDPGTASLKSFHAVKFNDGSVFDAVNGWTSRSILGQLEQLAKAEGDPQEQSGITPELRGVTPRKPRRPRKEAA